MRPFIVKPSIVRPVLLVLGGLVPLAMQKSKVRSEPLRVNTGPPVQHLDVSFPQLRTFIEARVGAKFPILFC
jgi:hypothetical protein